MARSKSKVLKNCVALLLITLVAGLALSAVNEITKEPIAKAEQQAKMDAYNTVLPNASFEEPENKQTLLNEAASALDEAGLSKCSVDDLYFAYNDSGKKIGCVMSATSPSGYGGDIKVAVGISYETNQITGFSVLSNSETAGLGAKCTEDGFTAQFAGKSATKLEYVKGGGASGDTQIDAISGATITTNAVTEAVNAALAFYNFALKEG